MNINFQTEKFITEIKKRKSIWDLSSDDYINRELKRKHWEEIVHLFGGDGLSKTDWNELCICLQKKWKNLRTCYTRELRRLKPNRRGSTTPHKTQYIYFNHLRFLNNNSTKKDSTKTNLSDKAIVKEIEYKSPNDQNKLVRKPEKNHIDTDSDNLRLNRFAKIPDIQHRSLELEEDRMFLLSLVSSFNKIPEHRKADTKIEIIKIISSAQIADNLLNIPMEASCINCSKNYDYSEDTSFIQIETASVSNISELSSQQVDFESQLSSPSTSVEHHDAGEIIIKDEHICLDEEGG